MDRIRRDDRYGALALLLALTAPLTSCGGDDGGRTSAPRPNIVLYVVDTLRADRLGAYGYEKPTSPRFDAFAEEAVLFENAWAQSSWTRPAVASMFTGSLPQTHRAYGRRSVLAEDQVTLAEILAVNGYDTLGLVRNPNVGRAFGFSQGFHRFRTEDRQRDGTMIDRVRLWLDERAGDERPFFLYLHAMGPHGPYSPLPEFERRFDAGEAPEHYRTVRYLLRLNQGEVEPEPETAELLSRLYDAEVAENDAAFGQLLDELDARGIAENSAVIHVSDHGEEFAEHDRWEHGITLFEEVLRVPFAMRLPDVAPRRVETAAQHVDLLPTLLGYLDIEAPPSHGRDLLAGGRRAARHPAVVAHLDVDTHRSDAVIQGRFKLLVPQTESGGAAPLLFDLEADPGELHDLSAERPDVVRRLREFLPSAGRESEVAPAPDAVIDPELRERLEALGYMN